MQIQWGCGSEFNVEDKDEDEGEHEGALDILNGN